MQISYSVEDMMQLRKLIQLQLVSAHLVVNKKLYTATGPRYAPPKITK